MLVEACKRLILILMLVLMTGGLMAGKNTFSVSGKNLLFNGQPFKIIGLRCSNALISDATTQMLIDNMDTFKSFGVNTMSVYFMGSRFGDVKGYNPDSTLNPVYTARMARIIEAADEKDMIILVGCLYWSTSKAKEDLGHWGQSHANAAVANTVKWLTDNNYTNVFVDPDNEGMSRRDNGWSIVSMIDAGHAENPNMVMGYNYNRDSEPAHNADILMHFSQKDGVRPWIESEGTPTNAPSGYWGSYSKEGNYYNYIRIGRYSQSMKANQIQQTNDHIDNHNGHMVASTYLQCAPSEGIGGPFMQPGGLSTGDINASHLRDVKSDAGIRWWLDHVKNRYGAWNPDGSSSGNQPPELNFLTPANGSSFSEGTSVPVEVAATDADGSVQYVDLFLNGQLVRRENNPPYEWNAPGQNDPELVNLSEGTYTLRAVAVDDLGATTERTVTFTVGDGGNNGGGNNSDTIFKEVNGVVSMEAENATTQEWNESTNYSPSGGITAINPGTNSKDMIFKINFSKTGRYYVWFRHMKPPGAQGDNNDCIVKFNGQDLKVGNGNSVIGMGTHQTSLKFQSRPKSHHVEDRGYRPFFEVNSAGQHEFKVNSRSDLSIDYVVDKIVLIHQDEGGNTTTPAVIGDLSGFGPAETIEDGGSTPTNNAPTISFANPLNNASFNEGDNVSVTVNAADADGQVTGVDLYLDGQFIRKENNPPYDWNSEAALQNMAAGSYTLRAVATDDDGATSEQSINITVNSDTVPTNNAPTVSFANPLNNASFNESDNVSVTANAADSDGQVTGVDLYLGSQLLGTDNSAPYNWNSEAALQNMAPGTYTLRVVATDDDGATSEQSISIVVNEDTSEPPTNTPPAISFANPPSGASFLEGASVYVKVNASDADGSISNVILYLNGQHVRQENWDPYEWNAPGQNDPELRDMSAGSYTLRAVATDNEGASSEITIPIEITTDTPEPPTTGDWSPQTVGSTDAELTLDNGVYTLSAAGADIWGNNDDFGFAQQDWDGDVTLIARVNSLSNTHQWAKAGLMIRDTNDTDSAYAMVAITSQNGVTFQRRTNAGEISSSTKQPGVSAPQWIKITRSGDVLRSYFSADGNIWTPLAKATVPMSSDVKVGMAVTSHRVGVTADAEFSGVEVISPEAEVSVKSVTLVNADTGQDLEEVFNNGTIDLTQINHNVSLKAEVNGVPGSLIFDVENGSLQLENNPPYYVMGNMGNDINAWNPAAGQVTIDITPMSESGGNGTSKDSMRITLNIIK